MEIKNAMKSQRTEKVIGQDPLGETFVSLGSGECVAFTQVGLPREELVRQGD